MVLDHDRLALEKLILGKQIRPNFLCSTSLIYKILPTNLGACQNQPFILLYITSEVKQYYGALFLSQQYFTVFQDKLHSFNIQDYRSTRGHLAKPIQKIFKITYTASRLSLYFWQVPNLQWTLIELHFNIINNLLCLFFIS